MILQCIQALVLCAVLVLAYENYVLANPDESQDMISKGRTQYQLLRERSNLPQYGTCWKSAVEHINDGCRYLSEETQSDIALHLTNCFLEMSGHETYNCEGDKKRNLRRICISSMTDRAFNVYTEFYTHTQNMCWFLRGQIWHETISENTVKVGLQLKETANNQMDLLRLQQESLQVQERLLEHGKSFEKVLEDLSATTKQHQDIIRVTAKAVENLQSFVVGELSWFQTVFFYSLCILLVLVLTSTSRTSNARIFLFGSLMTSFIVERCLTTLIIYLNEEYDTRKLYDNLNFYVWAVRYVFLFANVVIFFYCVFKHQNFAKLNYDLLGKVYKQNERILSCLTSNVKESSVSVVNESGKNLLKNKLNNFQEKINNNNMKFESEMNYSSSLSSNATPVSRIHYLKFREKENLSENVTVKKYNLRSRHGTPDSYNSFK